MHITHGLDLAIRVLTYLAMLPEGSRSPVAGLARAVDCRPGFLKKVLNMMVGARLLRSRRGFGGGFELGRPAAEISVLDVMIGFQGPVLINACLTVPFTCSLEPWCAQRDVWGRAQAAFSDVLRGETIDKLAARERMRGRPLTGVAPSTVAEPLIFVGASF